MMAAPLMATDSIPPAIRKRAEGPSALIVQSSRERSEALSEVLCRLGYRCELAEDPRDFQRRYDEGEYEILVFDLFMESMDGIEIVQWLIGKSNRTNALLTSGGDNFPLKSHTNPLLQAPRLLVEIKGGFTLEHLSDLDNFAEIDMAIGRLERP
jgi:hypothetical protein